MSKETKEENKKELKIRPRYRKIDPRIWNDEKFRQFPDNGKLAFLFCLTHPHLTSLGAMRASIPGLAAEMGFKEKAFREGLAKAFQWGMIKVDEKASFLWFPNFLKYNKPESPNVIKGWINAHQLLPECSLKRQLLQHVKGFVEGLSEGYKEAFEEAFPKTILYQEQELDSPFQDSPEQDILSDSSDDVQDDIPYDSIVDDLNTRTGKKYRSSTKKTKILIRSLWTDGYRLEDFQKVHKNKCHDWLGNDFERFLRPATLYTEKFEGYLNQAEPKNAGGGVDVGKYEELTAANT